MVERSSANLEPGLELPLSKLSPAFQKVHGDPDRAWTGVGPQGQAAVVSALARPSFPTPQCTPTVARAATISQYRWFQEIGRFNLILPEQM